MNTQDIQTPETNIYQIHPEVRLYDFTSAPLRIPVIHHPEAKVLFEVQFDSKIEGIYRIHCKRDDKNYIGRAKSIRFRLGGHIRKLYLNKHDNTYFQGGWNLAREPQTGMIEFACYVLYIWEETKDWSSYKLSYRVTKERRTNKYDYIDMLEKKMIKEYKSLYYENGYNKRLGSVMTQ